MQLHIFPHVDLVLHAMADHFLRTGNDAIAKRGRFAVSLSGGSSPEKLYSLLASEKYSSGIDWAKVFLFFGDERYVPFGDKRNNADMVLRTLVQPLNLPLENFFRIDTRLEPVQCAHSYEESIRRFFGEGDPLFDLMLLGLGDNVHTASLFPHTSVLHDAAVGVRALFIDEVNEYRITMTAPLINMSRSIAFLLFGTTKAEAVRSVLEGERNIETYPAQLIAPMNGTIHWFMDEGAASAIDRDGIDQ
jgi:6-phosphogluconolactonase